MHAPVVCNSEVATSLCLSNLLWLLLSVALGYVRDVEVDLDPVRMFDHGFLPLCDDCWGGDGCGFRWYQEIPDKWTIQSLIRVVCDCKLVTGSVSPSVRRLLHSWAVEGSVCGNSMYSYTLWS